LWLQVGVVVAEVDLVAVVGLVDLELEQDLALPLELITQLQ
jgi:hypothetical protein